MKSVPSFGISPSHPVGNFIVNVGHADAPRKADIVRSPTEPVWFGPGDGSHQWQPGGAIASVH